ncbi:hypothetical protein D9613_004839 [Agrocybe pediades]|uniref:ubiquitinyl hydrolase 1 n=1 Tax=Agrocybe pediades TaxID=84607 RepID=A0A8H4QZN7_9AGAR|nr:hypothetical protein D9613_004839 [Agrocybe pediades]
MNLKLILKDPIFQQVAPLVVLFAFPALVFFASHFLRRLNPLKLFLGWYLALSMGLESLGLSWLWSGSSSDNALSASRGRQSKRKSSGNSSKSKLVRTRAEQITMTNMGKEGNSEYDEDDQLYYPGLVNISGTYCFMNSTLQALASLTYLQPHIEAIQAKAETFDVPTPVIDALQELFQNLNTPKTSYHSLRPHGIINALSAPPPQILSNGKPSASRSSSLFNSREHQDAQELFQLISECIKDEMTAVDRESLRDRGIACVLDLAKPSAKAEHEELLEAKNNKSVFDGLTANRRSCVVCGYTEAVMHFGFDNWQLAVPRLATSCRLEDCLEDYTRLEILKDCICRKCSMLATHKRLLQELNTLREAVEPSNNYVVSDPSSRESILASSSSMPSSSPTKSKPSASKKKRYKEVKKMEQRIREVISEGRIEEEALVEGIRLEKTISPASTKQAMIARPPPVLALHLNRSVHYGQFAAKNTIRVYFPEVLDLTPFTTSGSLSTVPTSSISTPPPASAPYLKAQPNRPTTPTQDTYSSGFQRTIYRLAAVVCHYGQHSFGHYICYRRKPRRINGKWVPPTLVDPLQLEAEEEEERGDKNATIGKANGHVPKVANYSGSSSLGEARYFWEDHTEREVGTGRGWLRISDDSVSECGIETVLSEGAGAFMLYYEKAVHPRPTLYHPSINGSAKEPARSQPIAIPKSRAQLERGNARYDDDGTGSVTDVDGDAFSIGSEETLKPKMTVVDLNGSVGSLVSEVGVGVKKTPKKDKSKAFEKSKSKLEKHDSMSASMYLPGSSVSSSLSSVGFAPRIVRSVNARSRRNTPEAPSTMSSIRSSPDVQSRTSASPLPSDTTAHSEEPELDPETLADMTSSAPSILSRLEPTTSPSKAQKRQALGSKSTKVHHSPAAMNGGVEVKAI